MLKRYYDERFARFFNPSVCFTNDNGGGDGGDSGGGNGGGNGSQQNQQTKPAWAEEFGDNFDPNKAWSTIENLRRTEAKLAREKAAAERKVQEHESAGKTELEKAQARIADLEQKVKDNETASRRQAVQATVQSEAAKLGALYPEDIYKLISDDLEIDDEGRAKNVNKVINLLKADRPALFGQSRNNADAGAGRNGKTPGEGGMNDLIRGALGRG